MLREKYRVSMKYLSISLLVLFGLELLGCTGNTCGYSTWNIKDGWSNSYGRLEESIDISLEYPDCFYIFTKEDLKKLRLSFDTLGEDIPESNFHYVEFYRHIRGNNNIFVSSDSDYTHRIGFALYMSAPINDMLNEWDETIHGDETFLSGI